MFRKGWIFTGSTTWHGKSIVMLLQFLFYFCYLLPSTAHKHITLTFDLWFWMNRSERRVFWREAVKMVVLLMGQTWGNCLYLSIPLQRWSRSSQTQRSVETVLLSLSMKLNKLSFIVFTHKKIFFGLVLCCKFVVFNCMSDTNSVILWSGHLIEWNTFKELFYSNPHGISLISHIFFLHSVTF